MNGCYHREHIELNATLVSLITMQLTVYTFCDLFDNDIITNELCTTSKTLNCSKPRVDSYRDQPLSDLGI